MSFPNLLTMIRFVLIPVYLYIFFTGHPGSALAVLLVAGLTDVLDGYIARKKGQITELGIMLDPLADKLMMITAIFSFLYSGMIPWAAGAAIFLRDAGMIVFSAFSHFRGKKTVPANIMGKITTVLYYLAILLIVFEFNYALTVLWTAIVFSYLTTLVYIFSFRRINREAAAVGNARIGSTDGNAEKEQPARR